MQIQSQQFLKGSQARPAEPAEPAEPADPADPADPAEPALLRTTIAHPLASTCDVATICEIRSV